MSPPTLSSDRCYRALASRDVRFDGCFFVAVRTTGIYCRPICPARTPLPENCVFYRSAAAAEVGGFRPCRRCRPETAPGSPAWNGTQTTVRRALRLIAEGSLDAGSVDELALRLGVGPRHLRRLFRSEVGASPLQVAQTRRLGFALTLLADTGLPVTDVASAAGYGSLRRFHGAVRAAFGRPPSTLRGRRGAPTGGPLELALPYRPPYAWRELLEFVRPRAVPGVEDVTVDGRYRRAVRFADGRPMVVEVGHHAAGDHLRLRIELADVRALRLVAARVRRVFDLTTDPAPIVATLGRDPLLAGSITARPGLRIASTWSGFEGAVRAVVGQQVSVAGATTRLGRLAARYGEPLAAPNGSLKSVFPRADALAEADLEGVGLTRARAQTLRRLAAAVASGRLTIDADGDPEATLEGLAALDGIGEWTVQIVALRALGSPDALPAGDLGLRKALAVAGRLASPAEVRAAGERWRPWRSYATIHLWACEAARG